MLDKTFFALVSVCLKSTYSFLNATIVDASRISGLLPRLDFDPRPLLVISFMINPLARVLEQSKSDPDFSGGEDSHHSGQNICRNTPSFELVRGGCL